MRCKILSTLILSFCIQGTSQAGWGIKDLDPCNKNSGAGRCIRETRPLTLCGKSINVPAVSYAACQVSSALIPETCHPGVVMLTEGTACWASAGLVATSCAVSVESMLQIAHACIANR